MLLGEAVGPVLFGDFVAGVALAVAGLHPLDFGKVTNRCILVIALLVLVPVFRRSGLGPEIRKALRAVTPGKGSA